MAASIVACLERPQHTLGLDHLGTQRPWVFIYSGLLPGLLRIASAPSS